jgi:hypothetical protein
VAEPIQGWLQQLRAALTSERRLRRTRIVEDVCHHRSYSDFELVPRRLDVGTQVTLTMLGAVLLVGGATRSSLDVSRRSAPLCTRSTRTVHNPPA